MTVSIAQRLRDASQVSRRYWLPGNGYGNGLDDSAWAPILDLDPRIVAPVLEALRRAGVAAYAAPPRLTGATFTMPDDMWPGYRLWVGTSGHSTAEDVLMATLPPLLRALHTQPTDRSARPVPSQQRSHLRPRPPGRPVRRSM